MKAEKTIEGMSCDRTAVRSHKYSFFPLYIFKISYEFLFFSSFLSPLISSHLSVEANESLGNVVCYSNYIFVGTPKDFRIYVITTGDLYHRIEIGVTGMYSKRNLLLVALSDFRILLLNMKTKKPLGLLSGHTNWISSIGIYDDIGLSLSLSLFLIGSLTLFLFVLPSYFMIVVTTSADKTAMVWNMSEFVVTVR